MKALKAFCVFLVVISILLCIFTYEQLLSYQVNEYTTLYFREYNVNSDIIAPEISDFPTEIPISNIIISGIEYRVWYVQTLGDYIELEIFDFVEGVTPSVRFRAYGRIATSLVSDGSTTYNIRRLYIQYDVSTVFKLINVEVIRFNHNRVPFSDVINDEAGFFSWASTNIKVTFQLINNVLTLFGGILTL